MPPTPTLSPACSAIKPTNVVTVLLPLEPVIATTGALASRANNSMSPIISTPAACAACKAGVANATPGLAIIKDAEHKISGSSGPVIRLQSAGSSSFPGGFSRVSSTNGVIPR